jgi:hypothetical protein
MLTVLYHPIKASIGHHTIKRLRVYPRHTYLMKVACKQTDPAALPVYVSGYYPVMLHQSLCSALVSFAT